MIERRVLHFRLLHRLGAGGMGVVFEAFDEKLRREVALKFLAPALFEDEEAKRRLLAEARAAAGLDHPSICTIYEIGETEDDGLFIAMALYRGEGLDERLKKGPLPMRQALGIAREVAAGLAHAHGRGVIHRDIKPSNILLAEDGGVRILDFGLARSIDEERLTRDGRILGTVSYMSPEQVRGAASIDHRTDLWSLGCLLSEMLEGAAPFSAPSLPAIADRILRAEPRLPSHPPFVRELLARCLAKEPDARPATAEAVAAALDPHAAAPIDDETLTAEMPTEALTGNPPAESDPQRSRLLRRPLTWVALALLAVAAAALLWRQKREGEHRQERISELEAFVESENFGAAWELLEDFSSPDGASAGVDALRTRIVQEARIDTDPTGARIAFQPYTSRKGWRPLGTTPLEAELPKVPLRFRIDGSGGSRLEVAASIGEAASWALPDEPAPDGAVWIPAGSASTHWFAPTLIAAEVEVPAFFIDSFEISNAEYQQFVDAGGYGEPGYWPPLIRDGATVAWEEGIRSFVDQTGRPGPAGWQAGRHGDGDGALPVTGISWFEAHAFATWQGRRLPTLHEWLRAAELSTRAFVAPASNFGDSLLPRDEERGIGAWGTRDLAGNAKEWSATPTLAGERLLLGGSWSDPSYNYFATFDVRSPWDRDDDFGFRTVVGKDGETAMPVEVRPVPPPPPPMGDEAFEVVRRFFDYERRPLEVEAGDVTVKGDWKLERVTIDAGHADERLPLLVFTPEDAPEGRLPAVVLAPGLNAVRARSSEQIEDLVSFDAVDFLIAGGRVVVIPVFLGSYERESDLQADLLEPTVLRDHAIAWVKETRRTIDYLETRNDVDAERIAFYGSSVGACLSPLFLAIEPRFGAGLLRLGGLFPGEVIAEEAAPRHFAPRVRVPILLLNGRYDSLLPFESSQQPFFELLGTPEDRKRLVLFDVGHSAPRPRNRAIRETLDFLDEVFGPVASSVPRG